MKSSKHCRQRGLVVLSGVLCLSVILAVGRLAHAEQNTAKEYQIKAAFLYNFGKFVEWPAEHQARLGEAFVIGVFGEDPFGSDIDTLLAEKSIKEKKILIKRFRTLEELEPCHILFISPKEAKKLADIIKRLGDENVLTVSDTVEFMANGGMVNFVMEDNRVRFEINKLATDKAKLKLSSQLLKLARSVIA